MTQQVLVLISPALFLDICWTLSSDSIAAAVLGSPRPAEDDEPESRVQMAVDEVGNFNLKKEGGASWLAPLTYLLLPVDLS